MQDVYKEKLAKIIDDFGEYLKTDEAKGHLERMKSEKKEVNGLMEKLSKMDRKSDEFTDDVLYGLLPYSKSKYAKRVSLFPAFMNIKLFFGDYNYSNDEWNLIANKIFDLCNNFRKNPEKISELIKEFVSDKYSRRLQCGSITPLFFCLNDNFPIVNGISIRAFRSICLIIGENGNISQKLENYTKNMDEIQKLIEKLNFDLIKNHDYQDLFFFWYDTEILSEERRTKEGESDIYENTIESEEEIKSQEFDMSKFLEDINLENLVSENTHSLADPQRIKITHIILNISKTKWVLPRFQRYFDWDRTQVMDFWNSIFNDYYVGSFLLWENDKNPEFALQAILGVDGGDEIKKAESIILDGQQRITSLYYAIKSPDFPLRGSKAPTYFYVNFHSLFKRDLENGIIEVHTKKLSKEESFSRMLFPLYELENYNQWVDEFEDFLLSRYENHEKIRKIRRFIDRKLRYVWSEFEIPYVELPASMELTQVIDIFENINSKGKILTAFDLLIARLYKYDIELKKLWDATLKDYPNIARYVSSSSKMQLYVIQAMSLLYEKSSSAKRADILDIYKNIYEFSDRNFEDDWNDITNYMNKAIEKLENLRNGFGVKDEKEMPFMPVIPVLTAFLKIIEDKKNKAECFKKLQKWYWSAVFTNAYSSAADSQMTSDFKEVKNWFDNDSSTPKVVLAMTKDLSNMSFIDIQSKTNAKYRGVMSLLALEGSKDFDTSQTLEQSKDNDKDHIFPQSFKFNFGDGKYANSILNMTWNSANTNRKIKKAKKPSIYVPEFISDKYNGNSEAFLEVLKTHLINRNAYECLLNDDFEGFLEEREIALISKLKQIIDISDKNDTTSLISPETPFKNKQIFWNTIRSCNNYIYWVDKYFSKMGLELLYDSIEQGKVKEIKILTTIDRMDEKFRNLFKDFVEDVKNKGIKCELRIITDPKMKSNIHDRWIISKGIQFNIPSPDIVARGQYTEIKKTNNLPPFNDWWSNSKDIISDWEEIKNIVKNK